MGTMEWRGPATGLSSVPDNRRPVFLRLEELLGTHRDDQDR